MAKKEQVRDSEFHFKDTMFGSAQLAQLVKCVTLELSVVS